MLCLSLTELHAQQESPDAGDHYKEEMPIDVRGKGGNTLELLGLTPLVRKTLPTNYNRPVAM